MTPSFLYFDEHIINAAQIAHVSATEEGVHVDMVGGGFHELPGISIAGFGSLLNGAVF